MAEAEHGAGGGHRLWSGGGLCQRGVMGLRYPPWKKRGDEKWEMKGVEAAEEVLGPGGGWAGGARGPVQVGLPEVGRGWTSPAPTSGFQSVASSELAFFPQFHLLCRSWPFFLLGLVAFFSLHGNVVGT